MSENVFSNRRWAKQLISFKNMPVQLSDIDAIYDHYGKGMIYYELKHWNTKMTDGQEALLRRCVMNSFRNKVWSIAIVAEHETDDPEEDIDFASCKVRRYKINNHPWKEPTQPITLKEMTEVCIKNIDDGTFKVN